MDMTYLSEKEFVEELKRNINNLAIELFAIFKANLNVDELVGYMRNLLLCQEELYFNKTANTDLKQSLISLVDKIFRDNDIRDKLKTLEIEFKSNQELKTNLKTKLEDRIKSKCSRLDEYFKKPLALTQSDDNGNGNAIAVVDEKNLYMIKEKANLENMKYKEQLKRPTAYTVTTIPNDAGASVTTIINPTTSNTSAVATAANTIVANS
jgi:hypothetical protein